MNFDNSGGEFAFLSSSGLSEGIGTYVALEAPMDSSDGMPMSEGGPVTPVEGPIFRARFTIGTTRTLRVPALVTLDRYGNPRRLDGSIPRAPFADESFIGPSSDQGGGSGGIYIAGGSAPFPSHYGYNGFRHYVSLPFTGSGLVNSGPNRPRYRPFPVNRVFPEIPSWVPDVVYAWRPNRLIPNGFAWLVGFFENKAKTRYIALYADGQAHSYRST